MTAMYHFLPCVLIALVLISSILIQQSSAAELSLGHWMEWSLWSTCTEKDYCLEGLRERSRDCQLGKRCVGIEAESEMCPSTSCTDRPLILDIAHAEVHSFIAEECQTSKKFFVNGKFSYLMKHNIPRMFPRAKTIWQNSYFNIRITPKTLPDEKDIYRYCFEPETISMTLLEFQSMISTGTLRFKYASLQCPSPKPDQPTYVTGFAMGIVDKGYADNGLTDKSQLYGIYIQVKDKNGFKTLYYKHMSAGVYSHAYNLVWS